MGFHTDYGVREHYYQVHKKEFLYFYMKCGKGFFHKSKKSNHKKACPKKDEEDTHAPRALYDEELEKMFKRRTRVEVDVPEEVLDLTKQYQAENKECEEEENKECEEASAALQKELKKDKPIEVVADDDDFILKWIVEIQDLYLLKNLKRKYGILKDIMEMKDLFFEKKVDVVRLLR